jgi:protease-4
MPDIDDGKRHSTLFWVALGSCGFLVLLGMLAAIGYTLATFAGGSTPTTAFYGDGKIGVIDLTGVILSPEVIVGQLQTFADDSSIKAIVLHVNSPGGGAAASQEIYEEVRAIRKTKPIVASIESVGASGAYYIAAGTQKIYANEASVVGSIGVIMEWTNYGDLMRWAKLKPEVLKSGPLKDAGSPAREMTPEERTYFQGLVNNMYTQFVRDVAQGRGLPESTIKPLATGQVWTGQQALQLHLIDERGGFRDALLATARQVGIRGEPTIIKPSVHHRSLLELLSGDADDLFPNPGKLLEKQEGFYFLWR